MQTTTQQFNPADIMQVGLIGPGQQVPLLNTNKNQTVVMPSSSLETVYQLFSQLKVNPEEYTSSLSEQMIELFPIINKEDQKNFSCTFYKWAEKYKIKNPLLFCYARHLKLTDNFFSEQHETVLSEAPA